MWALAAGVLLASGWMAWSRWGPVRERRVPPGARVRQWNQLACGPAAVATLLNTYGVAWTRSGLEQECRVTSVGASLYGLREALRRRGFTAEGRRARSPQALCRVPRPFIAYLSAAGGAGTGHFVVAERLRGGSFDLFDPTSGEVRQWTAHRLYARGQGWVLAVSPRK